MRVFLTTFGLNESASTNVISHCNNIKALKIAITSNDESVNAKCIINMSQQKPDLFKKWPGGAYWNSTIPFKAFIDVIMHLLFLGVTKSCKELFTDWIKVRNSKKTDNIHRDQSYTELKGLGLHWLRLLEPSTGWVSENYQAFARIIKWFYYKEVNEKEFYINKDKRRKCVVCSDLLNNVHAMIPSILVKNTNEDVIYKVERK